MTTKTRIVRIGNSQGIRLSKVVLEQAQLPVDVLVEAEPGRLVVRAAQEPRSGWGDAAKRMRGREEDGLLDEPVATRFDVEDWQWR